MPLAAPVVALLRAHREHQDQQRRHAGVAWQEHDLVFTNEVGRYLYPDYVSTKFSRYARECGLPHIGGPHGLRHSLASALDANGSGLATISALLGHASTAVTSKVYTHMLKGADRTAVDAHAAALFPTHDEDRRRRRPGSCDQSVTNGPESAENRVAPGCSSRGRRFAFPGL